MWSVLNDTHYVCPLQLVPWQEAVKCLRAYSIRPEPELVQLSLLVNMTTKGNKAKDAFKGTLKFPHPFGSARQVLLIGEVRGSVGKWRI